ncbi:MAG: chromosomal replication initiator protein DnaA [Ruminococcus sp.]|nr:chromosomal replication initiator protein DnaA [Ruminococcus sp.]
MKTTESFEEVFEQVKEYCLENNKIPSIGMNTWIAPLKPVSLDGNKAYFKIQTAFQRDLVQETYGKILKEALKVILDHEVEMVIDVEPRRTQGIAMNSYDPESNNSEFSKYEYTFETFTEGRSNEFAIACCKSVAKSCGETPVSEYNPLFIYGASGMGKTHLVTAILNAVREKHPELKIIYITSENFANEFVQAINARRTTDFHEKYRSIDLFIIEDIQFFMGKERMQEELFNTFHKLHQEGKQIVITSDKAPRELQNLDVRLMSRLEGGLIADVSAPDYETRLAIISRKSELLELKLSIEVAEFIANRLKTNIRQLEGAVMRLKALNHFSGGPITISMAQGVIRDIMTNEHPTPITVEKIIEEVSGVYGVSPEDLRSNKRASQVSVARKVAIYIVRAITKMPLATIGAEFGGRDHSTIVYSITSITDAMKKDHNLNNLVTNIINNIKERSEQ